MTKNNFNFQFTHTLNFTLDVDVYHESGNVVTEIESNRAAVNLSTLSTMKNGKIIETNIVEFQNSIAITKPADDF
jgi:hypothetical protein